MTNKTDQAKQLIQTIQEYRQLGISEMIDYDKFYLYSLITHSTAIEGSTITEVENQLLFDEGITARGKSMVEQMMNIDLKAAYVRSMELARGHEPFSIDMLKSLSALVMRNTGSQYSTMSGTFDSSQGDLRRVNVTAGPGGRSYMNCAKVESALRNLCNDINQQRKAVRDKDEIAKYLLSIDAHYQLVTIHPWVDGNGRMSRLVMNMLQFELGLLPIKVTKEHKAEYINALEQSRETDSLEPFRQFMLAEHTRNLEGEIANFKKSVIDDVPQNVPQNNARLEQAIVEMIRANDRVSRQQMATAMGVSVKTIARQLSRMDYVSHVGSARSGHWEINDK